MAVADPSWRAAVRRYLSERVGQSICIGELVAEIGLTIPLHHATRTWANGHQKNQAEAVGPIQMRRFTLVRDLRYYPLLWIPGRRDVTDYTSIVPLAKPCRHCQQLFFGREHYDHCSPSCATLARWALPRRESVQ